MIQRLEVKGLNNRLDAAMDFNEDLNIITGRNGSGKTTLLKLIWYIMSGNLTKIMSEIPLRSVSIHTDAFSFSIERTRNKQYKLGFQPASKKDVDLNLPQPLRVSQTDEIGVFSREILDRTKGSLFFPSFRRIEGGFSRPSKSTSDDEVTNYVTQTRKRQSANPPTVNLQKAMSELSSQMSVHNHNFVASISTHDVVELLKEKYANVSEKVKKLHGKLIDEISQKITETRLLDDASPGLDGIKGRIDEANLERDSLLNPFTVLQEQIRKLFQVKGIQVTEEITFGEVKEAIASDKLSAGEKHLLSFLCYNTFVQDAAIFIDEPELSLHVDWQRRLLPTLLEQGTKNQFFVATHSPFIYTKYSDKEILLGEDRGDS